jgi:uncharacterized membrane protein YvlD (DUF360 family)
MSYLYLKLPLTLSDLTILGTAAVAIQMILAMLLRPKLHLAIFVVFGVIVGVFLMLARYITHDQFTIRPLLKAFITSGLISVVVQLVFLIARKVKLSGKVEDHEY